MKTKTKTTLLDILRNFIPLPKLPFLASLHQSFSTLCSHRLSKLWYKTAQKLLILSKEASYARCLLLFCITVFTQTLHGFTNHNEDPHYEWFEASSVANREDGIYTDSNKGMMKLNVVEYDAINDRYKVQCNCLKMPYMDCTEALCFPCEYPAETNTYIDNDHFLDLYSSDQEWSTLTEIEEQKAN